LIKNSKALQLLFGLAAIGLLASFFWDFSTPESEVSNLNQMAFEQKSNALSATQNTGSTNKSQAHTHDNDHEQKDSAEPLTKFPTGFNYQKEAERLNGLKQDFPRSKDELLKIILEPNPYSGAAPHSAADLAKRQKGALMVEALKTLYKNESDRSQLRSDLLNVKKNAQDPTISKIASAALESLKNNRPFFSDQIRALENLPIPE